MDDTQRKMTKIAREVGKFTVQMMKEEGIGTAEFDVIHFVRHHPGATQTSMRETLKIDKGAAAKRVASLEHKGYLIRKPNPEDGRSQLLYATEKAEELKSSKAQIETVFYEWLLEELRRRKKRRSAKRSMRCTGVPRGKGRQGLKTSPDGLEKRRKKEARNEQGEEDCGISARSGPFLLSGGMEGSAGGYGFRTHLQYRLAGGSVV